MENETLTAPVQRPVGTLLYIPIEASSDIETATNRMAKGNYPLTMCDCDVVGINGDCGARCPVFMSGKCPSPDGIIDDDDILPPNVELTGRQLRSNDRLGDQYNIQGDTS